MYVNLEDFVLVAFVEESLPDELHDVVQLQRNRGLHFDGLEVAGFGWARLVLESKNIQVFLKNVRAR